MTASIAHSKAALFQTTFCVSGATLSAIAYPLTNN